MKIPPVKIYFSEEDRKKILRRIDNCLSAGQIAQGKNVEEFEREFARFIGSRHAVAVSSGTSSIEISMRILDVKDREILVPTNTFLSTASSVLLAGGKVRLVDTDPNTFAVSLKGLEKAVTKDTAGVIIVHIGGIITPKIAEIKAWCDARGLWLFEDAAHAHGSEIFGKKAGTFGIAGSYSFFATKVMTSCEGGMVVTDNDDFAEKVRLLRNHGKPQPWVSYHTHLGSNWRMNEFAAAVGLVQLEKLDSFLSSRERAANIYSGLLREKSGLTLVLPQGKSSWYKYIVLLPRGTEREKIKTAMKGDGVSLSGGVYDIPLHKQPALGSIDAYFPLADDVCNRHICLPIYYGITDEEMHYTVETLTEVLYQRAIN
ncbi:MAG: DegT/DnrJ/EryC1/StrS family aminotransferase [Candidatus Brocadiales bacterium]